jgi:hypothetical protein
VLVDQARAFQRSWIDGEMMRRLQRLRTELQQFVARTDRTGGRAGWTGLRRGRG